MPGKNNWVSSGLEEEVPVLTAGLKLALGPNGFCQPLEGDQVLQCALCACLQRQEEKGMIVTDLDPYDLPDGLCEGHLFELAMRAEHCLNIEVGGCTIADILEHKAVILPLAA